MWVVGHVLGGLHLELGPGVGIGNGRGAQHPGQTRRDGWGRAANAAKPSPVELGGASC